MKSEEDAPKEEEPGRRRIRWTPGLRTVRFGMSESDVLPTVWQVNKARSKLLICKGQGSRADLWPNIIGGTFEFWPSHDRSASKRCKGLRYENKKRKKKAERENEQRYAEIIRWSSKDWEWVLIMYDLIEQPALRCVVEIVLMCFRDFNEDCVELPISTFCANFEGKQLTKTRSCSEKVTNDYWTGGE